MTEDLGHRPLCVRPSSPVRAGRARQPVSPTNLAVPHSPTNALRVWETCVEAGTGMGRNALAQVSRGLVPAVGRRWDHMLTVTTGTRQAGPAGCCTPPAGSCTANAAADYASPPPGPGPTPWPPPSPESWPCQPPADSSPTAPTRRKRTARPVEPAPTRHDSRRPTLPAPRKPTSKMLDPTPRPTITTA